MKISMNTDKQYAVLCAACAERMSEFFDMFEFKDTEPKRRLCRTCRNTGFFSEYSLIDKEYFNRSRR